MKINNKKGFTLAELLIVVAIIGILVAISIPVFTQQLKKARLATNQANARAAYSMAYTDYMTTGGGYGDSAGYTGLYHAIYDVDSATLYPGEGSAGMDDAGGGVLRPNFSEWTIDTQEHNNPKMGEAIFKSWVIVIEANDEGEMVPRMGCSTNPWPQNN